MTSIGTTSSADVRGGSAGVAFDIADSTRSVAAVDGVAAMLTVSDGDAVDSAGRMEEDGVPGDDDSAA